MRRTVLTVTAFAAALMAGSMLSPANASPFGNAAALIGAAEDIAIVDSVHCRPGWRHHEPRSWRRADGCPRRGGVVVVPGRDRYVIRDGVRVRIGSDRDRDFRSRTTIRSRTTVREGDRTGTRTTIRSGRQTEGGGRATVRSGVQTEGGGRATVRSGEGGMSKGNTTGRGGRGGQGPAQQAPAQQKQQQPQ